MLGIRQRICTAPASTLEILIFSDFSLELPTLRMVEMGAKHLLGIVSYYLAQSRNLEGVWESL